MLWPASSEHGVAKEPKGSVLYSAYSEEGQQLNGWVESNGVWTESWFHVKRQERSTEATSRVLLIGAAFS